MSGVSLTSRTAAQLIVDSSRLVAFRAYDVKTACISNLCGFVLELFLVLVFKLTECLSRFENLFVGSLCITCCLGDKLIRIALFTHLGLCHVFGVSSENNIGTAACHIGGYRHGSEFTRLSYDFGFFFVVLGVEYLVLYTAFFECL